MQQSSSTLKIEVNLSYCHCQQQHNIPVLGKCIASITHKNTISPVMFILADTNSQAILGADTYKKLQLIKRVFNTNSNLPAFLGKYQDSFGEITTLTIKQHITFSSPWDQ